MKKALGTALFFCATSCLVSLYLGQDNNFDLKNYHIYNAWAVLTDRWSQDIFAAGPQTYFSPLLDIPYYLVARELFPSHAETEALFTAAGLRVVALDRVREQIAPSLAAYARRLELRAISIFEYLTEDEIQRGFTALRAAVEADPGVDPVELDADLLVLEAPPATTQRWTVWRQDDNGNRYEVSRHDTRAEAEAVAATLEARGHKQTYWVSERI